MKKMQSSIKRGAEYIYTKMGDVVTAIEQVAVVKGRPMWEVEHRVGAGNHKRLIVSERSLLPVQPAPSPA